MKLSMWILLKWFENAKPTAIILEGSRVIEGTRLYSDRDGLDERFVNVCQTRDIYPSSTSEQVMIAFRNDMISLDNNDMNDVLNQVIGAFEFYNDWERRLEAASSVANSEQAIVDVCSEITGPMFIMDGGLNITAYSKGYAAGEVNDFWDNAILGLGNAFPDVKTAMESNFSKMHFADHLCTAFQDDSAAPYRFGISSSVHDADGNVAGQMVIASKEPMGPYDMQIAKIASEALDRSRVGRAARKNAGYSENIFYDLISHEVDERVAAEKLLLLQGWRDDDVFHLFKVDFGANNEPLMLTLQRLLDRVLIDAVVVAVGDSVIGIARRSRSFDVLSQLESIADANTVRIGVSNVFRGSELGSVYIRQAEDALTRSDNEKGFCLFHHQGLSVIMHASDRAYAAACVHPAVRSLAEWDSMHKAKLSSTLRAFLENERSYAKTARSLFVHRNTVLYRVERALEIAPVDLDDAYERLYLITSFLLVG